MNFSNTCFQIAKSPFVLNFLSNSPTKKNILRKIHVVVKVIKGFPAINVFITGFIVGAIINSIAQRSMIINNLQHMLNFIKLSRSGSEGDG